MLFEPNHEAVSLILFDIDRFKSINDNHGHGIGDNVLTELVEIIRGQLRRSEIFGRLGGEEFGILLPVPRDSALIIAERLLFSIRRQRFTPRKLEVTISMGLVDSSFSAVFDEMFKEADRYLYVAKKNGRNRLESAAGAISHP
jgi:diguanylate cyclase (GGDEF)-like protein